MRESPGAVVALDWEKRMLAEWNRCDPEAFVACLMPIIGMDGIMTRDDDYLREILIKMEAADGFQFSGPSKVMAPSPDEARYNYHLLLLIDAGLVAPMDPQINTCRMTGQGHDFLAATRRSEAWEAVKAQASKIPGASVGMLAKIAEAYVMQKARELGLPI